MPGVMELLPRDQIAFQRMLDVIRRNDERFGFLPIETPVMELSEVLLTKTGGETERQVYFVQSTGALEKQIGRAHVLTPVTNEQLVCRLLLEKKNSEKKASHVKAQKNITVRHDSTRHST